MLVALLRSVPCFTLGTGKLFADSNSALTRAQTFSRIMEVLTQTYSVTLVFGVPIRREQKYM